MEKKYSIDEILQAVKDLEKNKEINILKKLESKKIVDKNEIPSNTLKIIEEAEQKN
tara:strand:- start:533 stop:700 length:168 start_codon:yes stop_codon:yes gene_type:complete